MNTRNTEILVMLEGEIEMRAIVIIVTRRKTTGRLGSRNFERCFVSFSHSSPDDGGVKALLELGPLFLLARVQLCPRWRLLT